MSTVYNNDFLYIVGATNTGAGIGNSNVFTSSNGSSTETVTGSVSTSSLPTIWIGGVEYFVINLDVSEPGSNPSPQIQLTNFSLFDGDVEIRSVNFSSPLGFNGSGSGSIDYFFYIRKDLITTDTLYLTATFTGNDGGQEQFGFSEPGTISGTIFNDLDGDGIFDPDGLDNIAGNLDDETGLKDWTVTAFNDLNGDGNQDTGEPSYSTKSDASGNYTFSNLSGGTYIVRQVIPNGWQQTNLNPPSINVQVDTDITGVDFGNRAVADLIINKEFITPVAVYGEELKFKITVTNNGQATKGIIVEDNISQLSNIQISGLPSGWSSEIVNNKLTIYSNNNQIVSGQTVAIEVTGKLIEPTGLLKFDFIGQLEGQFDTNNSVLPEYLLAVVRGRQWFNLNLTKKAGSPIVEFAFNDLSNTATIISSGNLPDINPNNNTSTATIQLANAKYTATLNNGATLQQWVIKQNNNDPLPSIDVDWGVKSTGTTTNDSLFQQSGQKAIFARNLNWNNATAIGKDSSGNPIPGSPYDLFLRLSADGNLTNSSDEQAVLDFLRQRILAGDASANKFTNGNLTLNNLDTSTNQIIDYTKGQYTLAGSSETLTVTSSGVYFQGQLIGASLQAGLDNLPIANSFTNLTIVIQGDNINTRLQTLNLNSLLSKNYLVGALEINGSNTTFFSSTQAMNVDFSLVNVTTKTTSTPQLKIIGDQAKDLLTGSSLNDYSDGRNGSDLINGGSGNDWCIGGRGTDTVRGGFGKDILIGGSYDPLTGKISDTGGDTYVLEKNPFISGTDIGSYDIVKGYNLTNDKIGLLGITKGLLASPNVETITYTMGTQTVTAQGLMISSLDGQKLMFLEGLTSNNVTTVLNNMITNFSYI